MASPAQALAPPQIVDVPLSLFGGMHTGIAPPDAPEGLSPDNQDMAFVPGETFSRECLAKIFSNSVGDVPMMYAKTYIMPNGDPLTLSLDANGNLYYEDVENNPNVPVNIAAVTPGISAFSATAFGREYIAFSDLLNGMWPPLQYDGTNLDRVTQDGPGEPVNCVNILPTPATLATDGLTRLNNLVTATTAAAHGFKKGWQVQIAAPENVLVDIESIARDGNGTVTVTTKGPHNLPIGAMVDIEGVTPSSGDSVAFDGIFPVASIVNQTSFTYGQNGPADATATLSSATVSDVWNTTAFIQSVPTPTTFTYNNIGPNDTSVGAAGTDSYISGSVASGSFTPGETVTQTGSGATATLVSVSPSGPMIVVTSSITGAPDDSDIWTGNSSGATFDPTSLPVSGTATIIGQLTPGLHNIVCMFLFRSGAISKPSPPFAFYANGAQQMLVTDLPLGNKTVVARIIGATGAGGDNYSIIPATPQVGLQIVGTSTVVEDNTSQSVQLDFADNTLFDGIAIDQTGNDLFAQLTLISPIGFYTFASRLAAWGDWNVIQNLLNMTLGAGSSYTPTTESAGSGANGGAGIAWTNPNNITSASSYANVTVTAGETSKQLLAEQFGFAAATAIQGVSAAFQYYYTGGSAIPGSPTYLSVQLLQNGVPIGSPQTIGLNGVNPGASVAPLSASLNFPVGTLTPAEVNQATFGFEVSLFTTNAATEVFIRAGSMTVATSPLLPSGWDATDSTSITGRVIASTLPGIYLQYQMTSAGGAFDCLISQPAYQDPFGTAILLPLTAYTWRVLVNSPALAGNLIADLYSPSQGQLAEAVYSLAEGSTAFQLIDFSAETPAVIPADTVFRVYLSGVPAGQVVKIAEMSNIYTAEPTTGDESNWSYVVNPEGFDDTTGLLGSEDDPTDIRCFSIQRNTSILNTAAGTHNFQDNNGEPDTWVVSNLARSVGACSIRAGDPGQFGTGDAAEDWSVVANQNGLYLFAGGDFWKISQELEKGDPAGNVPTWQDINWSAEQTLCVKNDPKKHRIYILAPIFGATQPNIVWMCDYKELDTSSDLSGAPSLKIGITGKMLATDKSRKWSRWNIAANDCDITVRPANDKEMTFAGGTRNGAAYGNLYTLDPDKLTDDDYGQMFPYYTTYGFVNHEQEQALGLGTDRKLTRKVCAFITGVGYVSLTPFVDSLNNPLPATTFRFLQQDSDPSNLQNNDLEWTVGVRGERIFWRVQVQPFPGSTDVQLKIVKLIPHMMKDPVATHRASAV